MNFSGKKAYIFHRSTGNTRPDKGRKRWRIKISAEGVNSWILTFDATNVPLDGHSIEWAVRRSSGETW